MLLFRLRFGILRVEDATVYGPTAQFERKELQAYRSRFGNAYLRQWEAPFLMRLASDRATSHGNIASGFQYTGFHPLLDADEWFEKYGESAKIVWNRKKTKLRRKSAIEKVEDGDLKLTSRVHLLDLAGLPPNFVPRSKKPKPLPLPPVHQTVRKKPRRSILGEKFGDAHIANTVFSIETAQRGNI